jgi:hypothetical protein
MQTGALALSLLVLAYAHGVNHASQSQISLILLKT